MPEIDTDQVLLIAVEARKFLLEHWTSWHKEQGKSLEQGQAPSIDMCRFSTSFLKQILDQEIPEGEWEWVGGSSYDDGDIDREYGAPGGYHNLASGSWHDHYWVVDGGFDIIVDVTADQFGGPPIWVGSEDFTDRSDRIARCRYRENYHQEAVDDHMKDVSRRVAEWIAQWNKDHPTGWSRKAQFTSPPRLERKQKGNHASPI